jgi:hypothetical protein
MKSRLLGRLLLIAVGGAAASASTAHRTAGLPVRLTHGDTSVSTPDSTGFGLSRKINGSFFSYLNRRPFHDKLQGRIGGYAMGFWPAERRRVSPAYQNPESFIEVTPENQDTPVSEHFRLRDFLTHDQRDSWPKYLVLDEDLLDKLELVIADLNNSGTFVRHMSVLSGFRTPRYNGPGGEGRSGLSRHMYGDAADVFIDNDGNGRMDDLNRDGRVDHRDARVIMRAVERVERRHPALAGGIGVYRANSAHGPFAHVDVRGWRARWGLTG